MYLIIQTLKIQTEELESDPFLDQSLILSTPSTCYLKLRDQIHMDEMLFLAFQILAIWTQEWKKNLDSKGFLIHYFICSHKAVLLLQYFLDPQHPLNELCAVIILILQTRKKIQGGS